MYSLADKNALCKEGKRVGYGEFSHYPFIASPDHRCFGQGPLWAAILCATQSILKDGKEYDSCN